MEQKIDIIELLKDAPKGTKLYSPLYGEVEFDYFTSPPSWDIVVIADDTLHEFNNAGQAVWNGNKGHINYSSECLLFPAKGQTWENFKAPWKHKHFEPFQKVLVGLICNGKHYWRADIYSHYREDVKEHCTLKESMVSDNLIIPYSGNEDKLGKEVE